MFTSKKMVHKPNAIVIKLDSVTGLQTSRILDKYGISVIGIADDPNSFCCKTNSCKQVLTANTSNYELIVTLIRLGKKLGVKSVLFPCSDDSVLAISIHREELIDFYEFVFPDHNTIDLLMDKVKLYQYLERTGFSIPPTYFVSNKSEINEVTSKVTYPCIVKPPRPVQTWFNYFENKVLKVRNSEELYAICDKCLKAVDTFIIQEWIDGTESNIYQYYYYFGRDYKPIINYTSRKLRQWYTEMGEASLAEECLVDPIPRESIDIYSGIQYKGIISLEIKIDELSGRHFIIEPDVGRPNTSIGLVEASGVPILYTLYCDALGLPLPTYATQKYTGIKWISLQRDLQASREYYINGELSFPDWVKSVKGVKTYAVFSIRDPLPFVLDAHELIRTKARRRILDVFKKM